MKLPAGLWSAGLRWAGPVLLLAAMWWPEWSHYRIDRSADPSLAKAMAPASPQDRSRLAEIGAIDLAETASHAITPMEVTQAVESGSLQIPRLSQGRWPLQGYPDDLQQGPPTFRLFMASLSIERLLLAAWRNTGEARWLHAALDRITQFAAHEASRRHDRGFLWNDHAVAGRASTLILAWLALQEHPDLQATHAQGLLALAQRTGRMLAKPDQFTVRTNHGVMQNLALFQLSAAFPQLPEARAWRDLADQRLRLQLGFYVSPEGVVLEHSPGYHAMGTQLLAWAQRLRELNGLPADTPFDAARTGTARVLAELLRPDGTLPAIGNTDGHTPHGRELADPGALPANAPRLYPVSGWGLWWSDRAGPTATQLMFTWANHLGHGHKHADEGAFTWWSAGQTWITGVGYWPYGDPLVRKTYEWAGSNAPHGRREAGNSRREATLRGHATADGLRVADMERIRADGAHFRRTLLEIDVRTLLVLDFHQSVPDGARTIWTLGPDVQFSRTNGERSWTSEPRPGGWRMTMALDPGAAVSVERAQAGDGTAAGWTTVQREPREVMSLRVESEAPQAALASLFHLHTGDITTPHVALAAGAQPEHWQLDLDVGDKAWTVTRDAGTVRVSPRSNTSADGARSVRLVVADTAAAGAALRSAYASAVAQFPPWRDLWEYRVEASFGVLGLAVALEAAFACAAWWHRRRPDSAWATARVWWAAALGVLWLATAAYLLGHHLQA